MDNCKAISGPYLSTLPLLLLKPCLKLIRVGQVGENGSGGQGTGREASTGNQGSGTLFFRTLGLDFDFRLNSPHVALAVLIDADAPINELRTAGHGLRIRLGFVVAANGVQSRARFSRKRRRCVAREQVENTTR